MLTAFPTAVMCLTLYRVVNITRKKSNFRQSMRSGTGLTALMLFESECCFVEGFFQMTHQWYLKLFACRMLPVQKRYLSLTLCRGVCVLRLFNALWFLVCLYQEPKKCA